MGQLLRGKTPCTQHQLWARPTVCMLFCNTTMRCPHLPQTRLWHTTIHTYHAVTGPNQQVWACPQILSKPPSHYSQRMTMKHSCAKRSRCLGPELRRDSCAHIAKAPVLLTSHAMCMRCRWVHRDRRPLRAPQIWKCGPRECPISCTMVPVGPISHRVGVFRALKMGAHGVHPMRCDTPDRIKHCNPA